MLPTAPSFDLPTGGAAEARAGPAGDGVIWGGGATGPLPTRRHRVVPHQRCGATICGCGGLSGCSGGCGGSSCAAALPTSKVLNPHRFLATL